MNKAVLPGFLCLAAAVLPAAPKTNGEQVRLLSSAPLIFEPADNAGQFIAHGYGHSFLVEPAAVRFRDAGKPVQLRFEGASQDATVEGAALSQSRSARFFGRDRSAWRTDIPNYRRLLVHNLYPGIDAAYYGSGRELEYDFIVKAGADPSQIRLRFSGEKPTINVNGDLVAGFIQRHATAYQLNADSTHTEVRSRYRQNSDGTFSIVIGQFDRSRELIIDPVLTFSIFLSGSLADAAVGIGRDANGLLYVAGTTNSTDFPTTDSAQNTSSLGPTDIFVTVIDPTASPNSQIIYSTYLGGSGNDTLNDVVVTPSGSVYMVGSTQSPDFPLANAAQSTFSGNSDAFVLWLVPQPGGGLYYASLLGGSSDDAANGLALDPTGRIYITGVTTSSDFPAVNAWQGGYAGNQDAFVAVIDTSKGDKNTLALASYLGASGADVGRGIAVGPDGTGWVVGNTFSADFPVTGYSFQPTYKPGGDGFVAQFKPSGSLLYATFLGGSAQDIARRVVVDANSHVIVAGTTLSSDLPVTPDALQPGLAGETDIFLSILNPGTTDANRAAQLVYSTYFGGIHTETPFDLHLDSNGILYLAGTTNSPGLPSTANALQANTDLNQDGFVLVMNPAKPGKASVQYMTYLGGKGTQVLHGIVFDSAGTMYLTGSTTSSIFESYGGVVKPTVPGNTDAFVAGLTVCNFGVSLTSDQFTSDGGGDQVTVQTADFCPWSTTNGLDWVTISPINGTGTAPVQLTISANNTGSSRQGTVTIAGQQVTINQN
jgi:hypothetical protein